MRYKLTFNIIIIVLIFVIFGILYSKMYNKNNNMEYFYAGHGSMGGGGGGRGGPPIGGGGGGPIGGGHPMGGGGHLIGGGPIGHRGGHGGNWDEGNWKRSEWNRNYLDTQLFGDWNGPINNYIYNNDDKCSQLDSPFKGQCNDCEDSSCNYTYDNSSNTGKCAC